MKVYDIVAVEDCGEGNKPRYHNCGFVNKRDDGRMSIKLNSIPCGGWWNGWFSLFEPRPRDESPPKKDALAQSGFDENVGDEVPF